MMPRLTLRALMFCVGLTIAASEAKSDSFTFGMTLGCTSWGKQQGDTILRMFIVGFWSGMNAGRDGQVGSTTDAEGVIAEVRRVCQLRPSLNIPMATQITYELLAGEHR